jgi:sugar-specific transcriptional regulator TrmB
MNTSIFETLGLSPNEGKIYETLLKKGESSISEIALSAKIHRRNAYDAVQRLIDKGLCFQIISQRENKYNAVDPDKLKELFMEKQEQLEEALPGMKKQYVERVAPEEAFIYRGHEGQKNIWRDILRVGETQYFIGAKASWFDPRLEAARKAFFREANRKKIKFVQLFDREVKDRIPNFPKHFPGDLQYRFLPAKYSTHSGMGVFGDYIVTYTGVSVLKTDEDIVIFVIRSKKLADSYRTWFWYMWEQSEEDKPKK